MTTTTTLGVFPNKAKAESVIENLKEEGVMNTEISCVYTNEKGTVKDSQTDEKVGVGAATGATTGAVIGTIAGLAVANGILPGLGTLFVAGPLAAALGLTGATATAVAGAATGAAAGGLIGGLSKLGVDGKDAELYEKLVEKGDVLVICRSDNDNVKEIFNTNNASEVRQYVSND